MDVTQTHTAHDLEVGSPLISCRFDPTGSFVFAGAQDFRVWRVPVGRVRLGYQGGWDGGWLVGCLDADGSHARLLEKSADGILFD